jgi:lysophospholipase L1-like esterase
VRSGAKLGARVAALAAIAVGTLLALEGVSRVVWKSKHREMLELELHDYEYVDRTRDFISPLPGARVTVGELRADLHERSRPWGIAQLEGFVRDHALPDTAVIISVNERGFRGPDVAVPKPPGVFRILNVGDSCTWGQSVGDRWPYPRVLERELNESTGGAGRVRVEVVNGGFCADSIERSLRRVDDFADVDPDLVTIYQGWNRTIFRADPRRNRRLYRLSALYRLYYHSFVDAREPGDDSEDTGRRYDPRDPSLDPFRGYGFDRDIERLVVALRRRLPDAEIMLVTAAGLLDAEVEPDEKALRMSYPLERSGNLYLYALLAGRWNEAVRLYARESGLEVIDLERYARERFVPRSDYFTDNVHWNARGYDEIGRFLARELAGSVPRNEGARP